ncbi:hypothetical protein Pla163_29630 [Planctomycetes bacterium Pla163]|uniref:Right handed beta helix domain-containing protein n=1 Tax=Rohdeia mirabilis TaxID=2528008 RepID=A0A518D2W6_9BACT|nr:hypothetical protein Pla163_29630 [Planctomycetes bacterium Pla163]
MKNSTPSLGTCPRATLKATFHALFAAALLGPLALATDIPVAPGQSIQAAIDASANGDRILVQPGTYLETIDFAGKAIDVVGVGGAGLTTLDGQASGPVVRFANAEGTDSLLRGFTVRGGAAAIGAGGIAVSGATPTIEDCVVRNNSGKFGGGVSGTPVMRRCVIRNNTASLSHGGGLYGAPQLVECIVADNTATGGDGGGLYLTGGSASIIDSVVVSNRIVFGDPAKGAGLAVHSSATVLVRGTVIANNQGAGNIFGAYGGAVWGTSSTTLENCTIVGNTLVSGGNTQGAAIYGAATVRNCIVRDNTPGAPLDGSPTVTWSNVEGGSTGAGNFDAPPRFVDQSVGADYHLRSNSSCIDAGDPTLFDPDGSRSDVGAFPFATLYARSNVLESQWDAPSHGAISLACGGRQVMRIGLGAARAGNLFFVLGSFSGTAPGVSLGGSVLPLVADAYTTLTLQGPGSVGLLDSIGFLDASGAAEVRFGLPPGLFPQLVGSTVHHAALSIDLGTATVGATTDALALELVL